MQNKLKNTEPCPVCGRYLNRALSVDALVAKEGKILLILRGVEPYKGQWALPGGHVDFNETVQESCLRELREETGLIGTETNLLGLYSNPRRHPRQTVAVAFIVKDAKGVEKAGDDASDCKFFSLDSLPDNLAFDHKEIIEDFICHSGLDPESR